MFMYCVHSFVIRWKAAACERYFARRTNFIRLRLPHARLLNGNFYFIILILNYYLRGSRNSGLLYTLPKGIFLLLCLQKTTYKNV